MSTVDHIEALKSKHATLEHAIQQENYEAASRTTMRSAASRSESS